MPGIGHVIDLFDIVILEDRKNVVTPIAHNTPAQNGFRTAGSTIAIIGGIGTSFYPVACFSRRRATSGCLSKNAHPNNNTKELPASAQPIRSAGTAS
jgi:hypothetical protein